MIRMPARPTIRSCEEERLAPACRRRLALVAGLAATLAAPRLEAQAAPPPPVVFYMALATRESDAASVAAFRDGMRELGHVEGRSYALVERYAEGDFARARTMLHELAPDGVAVYLSPGAAAVRLLLRETQRVPIVSLGLHPRGGQTDLFASLAAPGGRVTGLSNFGEELAAKRVQLLKEAMPRLAKVGVLHNAVDPVFRRWGDETEGEIRAQGLAALRIGLSSNAEPALQQALRDARLRGVQALVVVRDFLTTALYLPIAQAGRSLGLAIVAEERRYPVAGALMSYGASDREQFGRAASYVTRILKGARAGELPIEQPTRFELVVNAATARGFGLSLPGPLLLRADEVIG